MRVHFITPFRKLLLGSLVTMSSAIAVAQNDSAVELKPDTIPVYRSVGVSTESLSTKFNALTNAVPLKYVSAQPYISLQQMLKGNVAGVYVQESTGEPGTDQSIFIHGISAPLFSKRELFDQQATVYLNGIPLVQDNPFAYEIQKYDFNRIGPATNLLAGINVNNIKSIEVIKDPLLLASLGPLAANGAIWITTKNAQSGYRQINVNSYFGVMQKHGITATNAAYENAFRATFYDKYGTINDRLNIPPYLRDSTNADYYGPATWTDEYYNNAPVYSTDLSLTGGSDRANFRFFAGATKNAGGADNTSISRYTGSFFINVTPLKWLEVSSMINYNRLERTRNRNIRDRLAEQRYLPDLTNPLTPNKNLYKSYLGEFDKAIDDNHSNLVQGSVVLSAGLKKVSYKGRIGFDYNEGTRDAFWPGTLLEGNNFVSNYFGYNQRFIFNNTLGYDLSLGNKQKLLLEAGQNFMSDIYKFNYAYAYNGPNDFIKINVVNGNPGATPTDPAGAYLTPRGFKVYYFPSKMQSNLASFSGTGTYSLSDILKLRAVVRRDGSSNMQPDTRWFTSYSAGADWNIKNHLFAGSAGLLTDLSLNLSRARIGRLLSDDRFNAGPHYRVDLGWGNEPTMGSYAGVPGISRPYTSGWVGYDIPWAYSDQLNFGVRIGALKDRLRLGIDIYNRDDKQQLFPMPVPSEWGYTSAYKTGMTVNNKGADISVAYDIIPASTTGLSWTASANLNLNKNELKALPGGVTELTIGNNRLEVGKAIDAFWVLKNEGIYTTDAAVPVNPATNAPMKYKGLALKAGDPIWADINGDFEINDKDRQLTGNYLPKVTGGFGSSLQYKKIGVDFQFYFALGRKVLNQYASSRLDFINTEARNDINSVKEITFWEKKQDLSGYPLYNPWSPVGAYRLEQDLFLDNASFLKLRTLSVNYELVNREDRNGMGADKRRGINKAELYLTATNLFTVTPFKGDDPELVNYNGIYTGYGLPIPRSLILGVKIQL